MRWLWCVSTWNVPSNQKDSLGIKYGCYVNLGLLLINELQQQKSFMISHLKIISNALCPQSQFNFCGVNTQYQCHEFTRHISLLLLNLESAWEQIPGTFLRLNILPGLLPQWGQKTSSASDEDTPPCPDWKKPPAPRDGLSKISA